MGQELIKYLDYKLSYYKLIKKRNNSIKLEHQKQ